MLCSGSLVVQLIAICTMLIGWLGLTERVALRGRRDAQHDVGRAGWLRARIRSTSEQSEGAALQKESEDQEIPSDSPVTHSLRWLGVDP